MRHNAWRAQVLGYPSKSAALVLGDAGARGGVEPVLILRSDSNVEDLAGHAAVRCMSFSAVCCAWAATHVSILCVLSCHLSGQARC